MSHSQRLRKPRVTKNKEKKAEISAFLRAQRNKKYYQNTKDKRKKHRLEQKRAELEKINSCACTKQFSKLFLENDFGYECSVCDRLWFKKDLHAVRNKLQMIKLLKKEFSEENVDMFLVCTSCDRSLRKNIIPRMSRTNGFCFPERPTLPQLDPVSERLISPRLPFIQIRRLQVEGCAVIGQVINVPIDVTTTVWQTLPRSIDDDQVFNVNIKKQLVQKSIHLSGYLNKEAIYTWLQYLENQPLYKRCEIKIDWNALHNINTLSVSPAVDNIEKLDENSPESDMLAARQQTLMWNEEHCLDIAPGKNNTPINALFDRYAEELSFASIYYGVPRDFKAELCVTPYMMATSEIRRKDRRGVTPQHILYMVMKILRLRVVDGIRNSFRCVKNLENVTRKEIESKQFIDQCIEKNFAFLENLPISVAYWHQRKNELFAMIRQLGKPTMFLTMSANEINWPHLLCILHRLNSYYKDVTDLNESNVFEKLNCTMRSTLVNEDPVTCCIYFKKMLDVFMIMLKSKKSFNPFGRYSVIDYFIRIEFQHCGSPHAHILLWLDNDPKEAVSEEMPKTVELLDYLCTVDRKLLGEEKIQNQMHKHTFACTNSSESTCPFNIPYWPMPETKILLPLTGEDEEIVNLKELAKGLKEKLSEQVYTSIDDFFNQNDLTYEKYLNIIRASLRRPSVMLKREMTEICTNAFNPWIAKTLNSSMDMQFILEEYSCAHYAIEYVNKSNHGISYLQSEMLKLQEGHSDQTFINLIERLSSKLKNTVEMSAQEAAWCLLRQPMCQSSREFVYIPTVWPQERPKSKKTRTQLAKLDENSTDIWARNIIQKYELRPESLENLCLADFVAGYVNVQPKKRKSNDGEDSGEEEDDGSNEYKKREFSRIIRYRNYEIQDTVNYVRELVTLFYPFRTELDILDNMQFYAIFEEHKEDILSKKQEYESRVDIKLLMEELQKLYEQDVEDIKTNKPEEILSNVVEESNNCDLLEDSVYDCRWLENET